MKLVSNGKFIGRLLASLTATICLLSPVAATEADWDIRLFNSSLTRSLDGYGTSVGVTENTLVIGTLAGRVHIHSKDENGNWDGGVVLTGNSLSDSFGQDLAISGNTMVISDLVDSTQQLLVYEKVGDWQEQAVIAETADFFFSPSSLSIDGDTFLVSGSHGTTRQPAAFVYRETDDAGFWYQEAKLTPDDLADDESFGRSTSISGDTAIISAIRSSNSFYTGSAYIFTRDSSGVWHKQAKLNATDGRADPVFGGDVFGITVAISGDTAMVGSIDTTGTGSNCRPPVNMCDLSPGPSSVYVFNRNSQGEWTQTDKLLADDPTELRFGEHLSIDGDYAVVGSGEAAYVYRRSAGDDWVFETTLTMGDDSYTGSVANTGDTVAVATGSSAMSFRGAVLLGKKCDEQTCIVSNDDGISPVVNDDAQTVNGLDNVADGGSDDSSDDGNPIESLVAQNSGGGSLDFIFILCMFFMFFAMRFTGKNHTRHSW